MATVVLRPEERPASLFDPRAFMLDVVAEYEALRAYLREARCLEPAQLMKHARGASRAVLRLALAAARAEHQANRALALLETTRDPAAEKSAAIPAPEPSPPPEAAQLTSTPEVACSRRGMRVWTPDMIARSYLRRRRAASVDYLPLPEY